MSDDFADVTSVAALCPVSVTWSDGTARITQDSDRLVAINPETDTPMDIPPRRINGWGDLITASDWLEESQLLAERCLVDLTPMKLAPTRTKGAPLLEWAPCVLRRTTTDNGTTHIDLSLTCIDEGPHFGETMPAALHIGWNNSTCQAVTGLYQLAQTAASVHKEAFDPNWAKAMFVHRSTLRVVRSAEKRLPDAVTWADANAALNSRSRFLATKYGIEDIRADALRQAERDGLLKCVKGEHGPGSKWLRTSKPLPMTIKKSRWRGRAPSSTRKPAKRA